MRNSTAGESGRLAAGGLTRRTHWVRVHTHTCIADNAGYDNLLHLIVLCRRRQRGRAARGDAHRGGSSRDREIATRSLCSCCARGVHGRGGEPVVVEYGRGVCGAARYVRARRRGDPSRRGRLTHPCAPLNPPSPSSSCVVCVPWCYIARRLITRRCRRPTRAPDVHRRRALQARQAPASHGRSRGSRRCGAVCADVLLGCRDLRCAHFASESPPAQRTSHTHLWP